MPILKFAAFGICYFGGVEFVVVAIGIPIENMFSTLATTHTLNPVEVRISLYTIQFGTDFIEITAKAVKLD